MTFPSLSAASVTPTPNPASHVTFSSIKRSQRHTNRPKSARCDGPLAQRAQRHIGPRSRLACDVPTGPPPQCRRSATKHAPGARGLNAARSDSGADGALRLVGPQERGTVRTRQRHARSRRSGRRHRELAPLAGDGRAEQLAHSRPVQGDRRTRRPAAPRSPWRPWPDPATGSRRRTADRNQRRRGARRRPACGRPRRRGGRRGIGEDGHLLPSGRQVARIVERIGKPIHNPSTSG